MQHWSKHLLLFLVHFLLASLHRPGGGTAALSLRTNSLRPRALHQERIFSTRGCLQMAELDILEGPPLDAVAVSVVVTADNQNHFQHDENLIAPPHLSRLLVYSSHLLLVTASIALAFALQGWSLMYGCFALTLLLYLTSVAHWSNPRFTTFVRFADIGAVCVNVAYGTFVATTLSMQVKQLWGIGISLVALIFAANEVKYYAQITRGREKGPTSSFPWWKPTLVGTQERENVYKINVLVHLICVHGLANALAVAVIVLGHAERM